MGDRPTRDTLHSPKNSVRVMRIDVDDNGLPDLGDQLAAETLLFGLSAGHDAVRSRQDGYPEAVQHSRHLVLSDVPAETRAGNPLDPLNSGQSLRRVLQIDANIALRAFIYLDVVVDEIALHEHAGDFGLDVRVGDIHSRLACSEGVAYAV